MLTDRCWAAAAASIRPLSASGSRKVIRADPGSSPAASAGAAGSAGGSCSVWLTTNVGSPPASRTSTTTSSSSEVISAAAADSTSSRASWTDESSASASIWPARATSSFANRVIAASSPRRASE